MTGQSGAVGLDVSAISIDHHAVMQVVNAILACTHEEKWKQSMDQTGKAAGHHFRPKAKRHAHMLKIGFPDAFRMLCEGAFNHGGQSLANIRRLCLCAGEIITY